MEFQPYYQNAIDLSNISAVETELQALVDVPISSVEDLKRWLHEEAILGDRISEVLSGHAVDFFRDTDNEERRNRFLSDQQNILPLVQRYEALLNGKFNQCPFTADLDDATYGLMKRVRSTELELFREENIPLQVRDGELVTEYQALLGGLTVDWDGQPVPLPAVQAQLDSTDRNVRFKAWTAIAQAFRGIKPRVDEIMDELVSLRHKIAQNAGFDNYRDYVFRKNNREYTIAANLQFHQAVQDYIVPIWDDIAGDFQQILGVDTFRPWDNSNCTLSQPPYEDIATLTNGVAKILKATDADFGQLFTTMLDQGYLDLGGRKGKRPGGFYNPFPVSQHGFVFANMSPSYFSLIALIHEMGHAVNYQYRLQKGPRWRSSRMEIAELFSHSMELLCLDKLDVFYDKPEDFRAAVQQRIRRSIAMLMGPLSSDVFQHWMYTHPGHSSKERDEAYYNIYKRYFGHPIDDTGYEPEVASNWIATAHYFSSPFYTIEYSMAELGALQLLKLYQENAHEAITAYKRAAAADDASAAVADIYQLAGIQFDFSDKTIQQAGQFVQELWKQNQR